MLLESFRDWIGMHKAMELWFHQAHHNVRGVSFVADHQNLYGAIYTDVLGVAFDNIIERGIGLTEDQTLADAVEYAIGAANILRGWPSPSSLSAEQLASEAHRRLSDYLDYIEAMRAQFELHSCLSLGLDDLIAGMCNDIETQLYLVGQRASF